VYSAEAVKKMGAEKGYVIEKPDGIEPLQGLPVYEFNDQEFIIIPVEK
jgi:hypothetical protein